MRGRAAAAALRRGNARARASARAVRDGPRQRPRRCSATLVRALPDDDRARRGRRRRRDRGADATPRRLRRSRSRPSRARGATATRSAWIARSARTARARRRRARRSRPPRAASARVGPLAAEVATFGAALLVARRPADPGRRRRPHGDGARHPPRTPPTSKRSQKTSASKATSHRALADVIAMCRACLEPRRASGGRSPRTLVARGAVLVSHEAGQRPTRGRSPPAASTWCTATATSSSSSTTRPTGTSRRRTAEAHAL